jgi:pyruvate/2-oxoglutarate dehydrogenase complex dihydrolipoamide acyltransferase (E2) component
MDLTAFPSQYRIVTEIVERAPEMSLSECIDHSLYLANMLGRCEMRKDQTSAEAMKAGLAALYARREVLEGTRVPGCGEVAPVPAQAAPVVPVAAPAPVEEKFADDDAVALARARGVNLSALGLKRTITKADVERYLAHNLGKRGKE